VFYRKPVTASFGGRPHLAGMRTIKFIALLCFLATPSLFAGEAPLPIIRHGCSVGSGTCTLLGTHSIDDGDVVAWHWEIIGPGVNATWDGPEIEWPLSTGCYDVKLTVTDNDGLTASTTRTFTFTEQSPVAPADSIVADVHSSTYETNAVLRNTLGNLNGILEPGEHVNVEAIIATTDPGGSGPRTIVASPQSTNTSVSVITDNGVGKFDTNTGLTDCWRVDDENDRMHCFVFGANVTSPRTTPHADFTFDIPRDAGSSEIVHLKLHVGASFNDVPVSAWYYSFVESILHHGLSSGCGNGDFCPDALLRRGESTVWALRAKYGPTYTPPACTTDPFGDVPCSNSLAPWIQQAVSEGWISGHWDGTFRPANGIERADVAVLIVRALLNGSTVPACSQDFVDVDCPGHWASAYISELKRRGATNGCGNGGYCPEKAATRAEGAALFTKAFGLQIAYPVCPFGSTIYN
jgi:S-layer family protein